ncbi:MAG: SDR family NAD(P)-dependent oxidoreductase [Nitrososphaerota archaeon]|nr:SDR family oxidoreductase [Candidatus Bathyarchaeota archaeon]MDW8023210.1 SDR family NAD(P)-dependent oxidoreductase [Nitrososphaerota archaeon]
MAPNLEGNVAFVTGAAAKRGMGRSIVLKLAENGADIVAVDKSRQSRSLFPGDEDWKGLDSVVDEVKALGRRIIALEAHIEDYSEVNAAVGAAVREFGVIDILVNCAGTRGPVNVPVVEFDERDWHDVFRVNVLGAFNVSKAVAKVMIPRRKGKIVHIVSMASKVPTPGSAIYNASKAAQLMLTKTLALELAPHNIDVYAINPGAFITNLRDKYFEDLSRRTGVPIEKLREEEYRKVAAGIPKGRLGKPEEIAELVAFLVSDKAEYLTGAVIDIAGGIMS